MEVSKLKCDDCIKCNFEEDTLIYTCGETGCELINDEIKMPVVCTKFVPFPHLMPKTQYYIKRK